MPSYRKLKQSLRRRCCMAPNERQFAHRVLLVDDDAAVRAMVNKGLERQGFEVVAAASVTEALRCITTERFDVLITGLHMPNPGDGRRLLLREDPLSRGTSLAHSFTKHSHCQSC